jgi:hypothetical protein
MSKLDILHMIERCSTYPDEELEKEEMLWQSMPFAKGGLTFLLGSTNSVLSLAASKSFRLNGGGGGGGVFLAASLAASSASASRVFSDFLRR